MHAQSPAPSMRTFVIIWLGQLVSMLGSGLTSFALGVWVFERTGAATPFALTVFFNILPGLLLSPLAGSLADRWSRKWLMVLADTGAALCTLVVFLLLRAEALEVWHIYGLAFLSSALNTVQRPAYMASVTMLVPKEQFSRASGMAQLSEAFSQILSPLLAGALFVAIGLDGIILIDFVTFFFAVAALLVVHIPQPAVHTSGQARRSVWGDAVYGWQYLRQRAGLFWLLWYYALVNYLLISSTVLLVPLILSFSDARGLGLAQMAAGVGMLGGSLTLSIWGGPQRRMPFIFAAITLGAVGLITIGLAPQLVFPAAGMFLLLFAIPLASGPSQAIFQAKVAPGVQGRVFAIRGMISTSIMPIATLLSGPLADQVFEPLMQPGGALAQTALGAWLGAGPGRGIGLMFVLYGSLLMLVTALAFAAPTIRLVESALPDIVGQNEPQQT